MLQKVEGAGASLLNMEAWSILREQCGILVKSGFLPKGIDTPEKALAIAMKGHEMGLSPMAAFSGISIVNGKPVVEGQLMMAQILRLVPGAKVEFLERTDKICRLRALRPGSDWQEFSWTIEQAKAADLTGKDVWKKYPRNMLQWRAVADMARALFPDAIMGAYLHDEMEHVAIDVTPKANAKGVQDLLAAPEPQPAPEPEPPIDDYAPPRLADPKKLEVMFQEFAKIGIPKDVVLAEMMCSKPELLTERDMDHLRDWYNREAKARKQV